MATLKDKEKSVLSLLQPGGITTKSFQELIIIHSKEGPGTHFCFCLSPKVIGAEVFVNDSFREEFKPFITFMSWSTWSTTAWMSDCLCWKATEIVTRTPTLLFISWSFFQGCYSLNFCLHSVWLLLHLVSESNRNEYRDFVLQVQLEQTVTLADTQSTS